MICVINQASYLLRRIMVHLENKYVNEGGMSERMRAAFPLLRALHPASSIASFRCNPYRPEGRFVRTIFSATLAPIRARLPRSAVTELGGGDRGLGGTGGSASEKAEEKDSGYNSPHNEA